MTSWRWVKPVPRTPEEEQADRETMEWFDRVSDDELAAHAGKWIVQYRGKIIAVRRTAAAAYAVIDHANLPKGAAPAVYLVPPPDLVLLGPRAFYGGRLH